MGLLNYITHLVVLAVSFVLLTSFVFAADDEAKVDDFITKMEQEAQSQYQNTKTSFLSQINIAQSEIEKLREERKRVSAQLKSLVLSEKKGLEFFKRYQSLIKLRASDETGKYNPAAQVKEVDVENINRLFKYFLNSIPFQGRVAASIADKTLIEGMERLNKLIEIHTNPSEQNNSDLAIIKYQEEVFLEKIRIIEELGKQYNILNSVEKK